MCVRVCVGLLLSFQSNRSLAVAMMMMKMLMIFRVIEAGKQVKNGSGEASFFISVIVHPTIHGTQAGMKDEENGRRMRKMVEG